MNFNRAYKQIRNRLRRFHPESVVATLMDQLQNHQGDQVEALREIPWQALLTVKWCLQDSMAGSQSMKEITHNELVDIRNSIWQIPDMISQNSSFSQPVRLMMRQLMNSQIEFQKPITMSIFREASLIDKLGSRNYLYNEFLIKTGISPSEFIDFTFAAHAFLNKIGPNFRIDNFVSSLMHIYSADKIQKYIALVSVDYTELVEFFRSLPDTNSKKMSELYEFPVIERFPFFRENGVLRCWHQAVFCRGSAGMLHSVLSEHGSDYIERFSKIFENHCISLTKNAGGIHHTDEELKRYLPENCKNPDAMLAFESCNIFIEIKSGIFGQSVMTVGSNEVFRNKTRALRAAVQQAWEASKGLRTSRSAPERILEVDIEYLLIVTNKELSSGRGSVLKEIYPEGTIDEPDEEIRGRLPLSNVYVVSIEDFERMMEACRLGEISLPSFIASCIERDDNPNTSMFYMEQHLTAANITKHVSSLVSEAFENSSSRLQGIGDAEA